VQLGPIVRKVTRDTIAQYEGILGIGNPLHFDAAYAQTTPFAGIIAHGMMLLGYISEMMAAAFAEGWYSGGELDTTFVRPIRPGDTITTSGKITGQRRDGGQITAVCEVCCENQEGETVLKGTASALVDQIMTDVPDLPHVP
jgi:3-hydroxybutyryl-CoA dehydratase